MADTTKTNTEDVGTLIARLREAKGADRELDYAIHELLHGEWLAENGYRREGAGWWSDNPPLKGSNGLAPPQEYTTDINAALFLIPDGYQAISLSIGEPPRSSSARLGHPYVFGNAPTPALAIAICALEARRQAP